MDLVEQVHIFGLANIGHIISLIRLFSLMLNCAKPRITAVYFRLRKSFCFFPNIAGKFVVIFPELGISVHDDSRIFITTDANK